MLDKLRYTDFFNLIEDVNNGINVTVTGLNIGEKGLVCNDLSKPIIFVAPSVERAEKIEKQLLSLNLKTASIKYVDIDPLYSRYSFNEADIELNKSIFKLLTQDIDTLVVTSKVLSYRLPSPQIFKDNILKLSKNNTYNLEDLKRKLTSMGYSLQSMLEGQGQYSYRGDCIDIFPINSSLPYRISFFDDTIEFIKAFNIESYSSIEEINSITICPNTLLFLENQSLEQIVKKIEAEKSTSILQPNAFTRLNNLVENISIEILNKSVKSSFILPYLEDYNCNILSYINKGTVVFDEVKRIYDSVKENIDTFLERFPSLLSSGELLPSHENFLLNLNKSLVSNVNKLAFININTQNRIFQTQKLYNFSCEPIISYNGDYSLLAEDLMEFLKKKYFVTIFTQNDTNCVNVFKNLQKLKVPCKIVKVMNQCEKDLINISPNDLYRGVNLSKQKVHLISINEIFSKKENEKVTQNKKRSVFYLPKVGEWVVHNVHGVGICDGIERLKFGSIEKDYIIVRYKDNDKYYLPTEKIQELASYISNGAPPKLNKLGSDEFEREKEKVKASVKKMAFSLLNLYAERQYQKGFRYNIDPLLYEDFCNGFEHKETEDQLMAIDDIQKDMQSDKVMDRLICGDVGFGKTEVSFRAIFIACMNSKQVALLCPTTILSEQHYNTCTTRLAPYMVNVEVINRFKTPKQQKEILQRVKEGKVDVLIGTTRLLSKDVEFKNLGLLVLDEEQKFGVEAKEKLKNLKKNIDVLTLSATPIPRTLHISMSGIRDISIIETPPTNRLPVQTIVTEYSDTLIKDAIYRELKRNGQVLIVYNRIETIFEFFSKLSKLIPDAKIDVAHGRMEEKALYNAIKNLYEKKTDILISTTLIENGVDLPSANTLICINSENLGLSELYQLKGRVGRSSLLAYAYFTYPENKIISEDAFKRLSAISEFSSLGSGFKIAMRDLEIRGAGNVLGKEQHGHITRVGYDMYCKLLKEATEELKGKRIYKARDCKILIDVSAFIPNNFVPDNETRFRLYNTISNVDSLEEMNKIKEKITDMFKTIPYQVENLIKIALIQNLASKMGIKQVTANQTRTCFMFYKSEDMLIEEISEKIKKLNLKVVYNLKDVPIIDFDLGRLNLDKKIDFIINFLTFDNKSIN